MGDPAMDPAFCAQGRDRRRVGARLASCVVFSACLVAVQSGRVVADPILSDATIGTLELVTPDPAEQNKLNKIDGLAFDPFGNLLGVKEILGETGGVVYIDKQTGAVTVLVTGISRADQIALHPSGDLLVTSEVTPGATTDRVYRVTPAYNASNVPTSATATSLTTSQAINNPEGLVVLDAAGPFGDVGDLYVAEDIVDGKVFHVDPDTGTTTAFAGDFRRPEGMALGDFGGLATLALYAAETSNHRVLRIDSDGNATTLGDPTSVSMALPDNVEFGPDGFLYVSEDRAEPDSRIIRIAADGTHRVFATGFSAAQGLVFDANRDLYISEQGLDRIWRVVFNLPGDANGDGVVDLADFNIWSANYGAANGAAFGDGDFSGDGSVTLADYNIWTANYGASAAATPAGEQLPTPTNPEPPGLPFLAVGALVLIVAVLARRGRALLL